MGKSFSAPENNVRLYLHNDSKSKSKSEAVVVPRTGTIGSYKSVTYCTGLIVNKDVGLSRLFCA